MNVFLLLNLFQSLSSVVWTHSLHDFEEKDCCWKVPKATSDHTTCSAPFSQAA